MSRGLVAFVLHAHLPYVRHPEQWELIEERWLYEAISDSYLPLIDILIRLADEGIETGITLSVSPTLATMLRDPLLMSRYREYAEALRDLTDNEAVRAQNNDDQELLGAIRFFQQRLEGIRQIWEALGGDPVGALAALESAGKLELMTTAATHAYLPLMQAIPEAIEAQVAIGVEQHRRLFGRRPEGFWLPECGWEPSLEGTLLAQGIHYVVLETHGIGSANPHPHLGSHAPLLAPGGLAVFGRDQECSKQVWSATEGYPADPVYREFFRDVGWERLPEELGRLRHHPEGGPLPTGLKLYRITGATEEKRAYSASAAAQRAREHARDFVRCRRTQVEELAHRLKRPPLIVAPFDAELFGHWWFEGPLFLEEVIRRISRGHEGLELISLRDYLERWPEAQISTPSASSWGEGGFSQVWLDDDCLWIHQRLHGLGRRLTQACRRSLGAKGKRRRALNQAVRELLLAQASDWPFLIRAGTARDYAKQRVEKHLDRVSTLLDEFDRVEINEPELSLSESATPLFPWMDFESWIGDKRK